MAPEGPLGNRVLIAKDSETSRRQALDEGRRETTAVVCGWAVHLSNGGTNEWIGKL